MRYGRDASLGYLSRMMPDMASSTIEQSNARNSFLRVQVTAELLQKRGSVQLPERVLVQTLLTEIPI